MKRIVMVAAVLALAIVGQAQAQEQELLQDLKENAVEMALDFTICAGLLYAGADVGREIGRHPDEIQSIEEEGNGWAMAAYWALAHGMGDWEDAVAYVDEQVASQRAHWRARLRLDGAGPWLDRQRASCDTLAPAQEWIVGELRKKVLTLPR
jgi:hypothetical protein